MLVYAINLPKYLSFKKYILYNVSDQAVLEKSKTQIRL